MQHVESMGSFRSEMRDELADSAKDNVKKRRELEILLYQKDLGKSIRGLRVCIDIRDVKWIISLSYLAGIAVAELFIALANPAVGICFHLALVIFLAFHSALAGKRLSHELYLALSLAPLTRIVSLSLDLSLFSQTYTYLIYSLPLLVGSLITIRMLKFKPADIALRLRVKNIPIQLLVALTGIVFGLIEFYLIRPDSLVSSLTLQKVIVPALILLIATGFVEELAFRGVIQRSAISSLGPWGLVYTAMLFAMMHIGYLSASLWLLVFVAGIFFGWTVKKTGSLFGVTLSHGLANICLYIIFPLII